MTRLIVAALAAGTLATAIDGGAQPSRPAAGPSPASIDSIFARYDHTNTPGCAVGVYRDDRIVFGRGYGMADLNQGVPIGTKIGRAHV